MKQNEELKLAGRQGLFLLDYWVNNRSNAPEGMKVDTPEKRFLINVVHTQLDGAFDTRTHLFVSVYEKGSTTGAGQYYAYEFLMSGKYVLDVSRAVEGRWKSLKSPRNCAAWGSDFNSDMEVLSDRMAENINLGYRPFADVIEDNFTIELLGVDNDHSVIKGDFTSQAITRKNAA